MRRLFRSLGEGLQMRASDLRDALVKSPTMGQIFLKFTQTAVLQTAHTAVANSVGKLHERLARWLPMAHDRVESDQLRLTHEFLSIIARGASCRSDGSG